MKYLLVVAAAAAFVGLCQAAETGTSVCFLRDGAKSDKPFPSLTQCYKNNQDSCCVSAHDATIQGVYEGLLSSTCLREYQDLEHYFCLGCNPNMYKYIEWYNEDAACASGGAACKFKKFVAAKQDSQLSKKSTAAEKKDAFKHGKYGMVRVCKSFLDKLLFSDTAKCDANSDSCTIDRYDNCGLNVKKGDGRGWFPSARFVKADGKLDVYGFLDEIRPSYFEAAEFHLVADIKETTKDKARTLTGAALCRGKLKGDQATCAAIKATSTKDADIATAKGTCDGNAKCEWKAFTAEIEWKAGGACFSAGTRFSVSFLTLALAALLAQLM